MFLVVKYVKGRNPPISDLEGDFNVESDCDGDIPGAEDAMGNAEETRQTRAVLITGSFSAYVYFDISLFRRG